MCVITIYAKLFQTKGLNNLKPSIVKIYTLPCNDNGIP